MVLSQSFSNSVLAIKRISCVYEGGRIVSWGNHQTGSGGHIAIRQLLGSPHSCPLLDTYQLSLQQLLNMLLKDLFNKIIMMCLYIYHFLHIFTPSSPSVVSFTQDHFFSINATHEHTMGWDALSTGVATSFTCMLLNGKSKFQKWVRIQNIAELPSNRLYVVLCLFFCCD